MTLSVVHYGDPVLRKKGDAVTVFDAALKQLADDMVETMHATNGIGLAAPKRNSLKAWGALFGGACRRG